MKKKRLLTLLALLMTAWNGISAANPEKAELEEALAAPGIYRLTSAAAAAENVTNIIFNNLGLENAWDLTSATLTVGNIELNFDKADGSNPPAFYTTGGGAARLYKGNTMSVDAGGATITKIVFTYASDVTPAFSTGSYTSSTKTWEGEATTLTVTNAYTTNTQIRIKSMDVYYTAAPPVDVTGVTLPATATVTLGDPVALTAAVAPADATDKKVKWTVTAGTDKVKLYKDAECKTEVGTDATDVLTVYAKGLAAGEATVKVESNADATKTATCAVTAKHGTYAVAMKAGTTEASNWTARAGGTGTFAEMPLKGVEGGTKPVELKYAGDREVKRVTATVTPKWKGDLSKISATELESDGVTVLVKDGMTLTGTLSENYKITIADGATVTLDGVTINGTNDENYKWAGISCAGNATINLADGSENTVKGFHSDYPGIHVPMGSTLTIQGGSEGTGKLTANSNGNAAGIGGGKNLGCGNIVIAATVGKVKAIKGSDAPYSIGAGQNGSCGTVTIGGTVYWQDNAAVGDGATYLAQATIVYPAPAGNSVDLSTLTGNYEAQNGDILTGATNYAITIAAGATVTLDGVNISSSDYCIKCLGDATIILKDGSTNTLTSWSQNYPALWAGDAGTTLTIQGSTGVLNVTSGEYCAGIGGGYANTNKTCGNIRIEGGVITAQGGNAGAGIGTDSGPATCGDIIITGGTITANGGTNAAGIGGGFQGSCGNISITGGTVNANGGKAATGIGSGQSGSCGTVTITDGVTSVTATKGNNANYSIGAGNAGSCGTVTIGGTKYWQDNAAVGDGATYLAQATIEYPTPVAFAANEYNEASWDGSKVVFTKKTAASTPTAVANSNTAVTWSDGWYTVAGEVTISGNVTLGADTYLILQDGATLTINGQLNCRNNQKNLYIYGQKKGDGKLNVICSSSSAVAAIYGESGKTVEIHGGEITAEGYNTGLFVGYIIVFSGKITATCGSYGTDGIVFGNSCDVYGGEIEATTNNFDLDSRGITDGGNGTFTVYGGKVKATGSGVEVPPYYGSCFSGKVKSGTAGIKFYFSDNGTDWDEGTYYGTATAAPLKRYAKAE